MRAAQPREQHSRRRHLRDLPATLHSWQRWTLVAEVQHSHFSFIFSLGWPCSYFPHENTAPRFVPSPHSASTSLRTSHPPCSPQPLLQTASHCVRPVLGSSRWVQILTAVAGRLHNRTSPALLSTNIYLSIFRQCRFQVSATVR